MLRESSKRKNHRSVSLPYFCNADHIGKGLQTWNLPVCPMQLYASYPECGMIEFSTFSSGFGSETVYEGFYYSDEDVPFGFQGASMSFQSDGGGWSWHESDGDNFEYTEKILGKWYWYRMHF